MRPRLGIRGKLFLISFAIIVVTAVGIGLYLETRLRDLLTSRIEGELTREARIIASLLESSGTDGTSEALDPLADRLGRDSSARVTIISEDGTVLGDSGIPAEEIGNMENHADRPEVVHALGRGLGQFTRLSSTLETYMLYIAVPYEAEHGRGVVRVAMPLSEVDQAVGRLRAMIAVGVLVGLIVAGFMIALASQFMSGTLRTVVTRAKDIVEGRSGPRLVVSSHDELSRLAGSINRMADELEGAFAELATERDHLEAVLEGIEEAVVAVDGNQTITLVNESALKLLELSGSPVGRSLLEVIRVPVLYDLASEARERGVKTVEFDLPTSTPRRILAHVTSQRSGEGKVIVLRDVTAVRKLEQARRDFFANASHELRTPVGIIQANAETLMSMPDGDPDKTRAFLDAIHRNSERLSSLISDLLQISRIEEGKYTLDMKPVDVQGPAYSAADAMERPAQEKEIGIERSIPDDLMVLADRKALEDVLFNILDNAVKYTQKGGRVIVRGARSDGRVRIEVEDNGPGIPPKDRERVFERFYRGDAGRSRETGGTGLGLSIVKHLVTVMGGSVKVEPAAPHGCVFVISLKAVPVG